MSISHDFCDYQRELELSREQSGVECDLYSIVAQIIRDQKNGPTISLRDVSARRRSKDPLWRDRLQHYVSHSGFPDFVILRRDSTAVHPTLGAVEIKNMIVSLDRPDCQAQLTSHLEKHRRVLHTNGLTWRFYDSSMKPQLRWEYDLGSFQSGRICWKTGTATEPSAEQQWDSLLKSLAEIEWVSS